MPTLSRDWNQREEFFNYTRGRFLRNQAYNSSQRHMRFDMNELVRMCPQILESQAPVATVEKYPDGWYTKAFLMTLEDGKEAVVKIPNPTLSLSRLTTASEVATMTFMRDVCETPVPRVLAWNSDANNSVGAEYIFLEKVPGVQLGKIWHTLRFRDRVGIIKSICRYEERWRSIHFKQFGNLYFAKDIAKQLDQAPFIYKKDGVDVSDSRFAIGPTVHSQSVDDGRASIDFDRGPWDTPQDYYLAIGQREKECIKNMKTLPPTTISLPCRYVPSREKKLAALETYMKLVPFLLPLDTTFLTPHLYHRDLHEDNIFVDPDNHGRITGIIDWQSAWIAPYLEHASIPEFLEHESELNELEQPIKPDVSQMDPDERARALTRYWDTMITFAYRAWTWKKNDLLRRVSKFRQTLAHTMLLFAPQMLLDGEAVFQHLAIAELKQEWEKIVADRNPRPPFPLSFTDAEVASITTDYENTRAGIEYLRELMSENAMLRSTHQAIAPELYEEAVVKLRNYKALALRDFARNEEERAALNTWWAYDSA